jgi:hypothetical protein
MAVAARNLAVFMKAFYGIGTPKALSMTRLWKPALTERVAVSPAILLGFR